MTFSITVAKRKEGNAQEVRGQGLVPGVVYGPDRESVAISVDALILEKLYNEAGESSLIDFNLEGEESVKVLVQAVQYDAVKGNIIHVDFRQIRMGVEMNASIDLIFVGESQAVKEGGTLSTAYESLNVRCLPKDLVTNIEVDLSVLATFDDAIHIADLKLPEGVIATDDENTLVAKVTPPLTEDQLKAMEEADTSSIDDVEVEGKKKEDGEEAGEDKKETAKSEGSLAKEEKK